MERASGIERKTDRDREREGKKRKLKGEKER